MIPSQPDSRVIALSSPDLYMQGREFGLGMRVRSLHPFSVRFSVRIATVGISQSHPTAIMLGSTENYGRITSRNLPKTQPF